MQVLLGIVLALAAGLLSTRLVKLIHLPNVTGYLVAGLLIGVVNIITYKRSGTYILDVKSLSIIVDLALGFIAFSIGGEFKLTSLKKLGKSIFTITFLPSCVICLCILCTKFFSISISRCFCYRCFLMYGKFKQ